MITLSKNLLAAVLLVSVIALPTLAESSDWWEKIKFKGDFRYRHETINLNDNGASSQNRNRDTRNRHRIRARFGLVAEVSEHTNVVIQLATGSDDPVSSNQTLGDGGSTKSIGLDLAYFEKSHTNLPGLTGIAGKFKNPFYKPGKTELIWDSDWNPEGGAAIFKHKHGKTEIRLVGSGLWIEERSKLANSYVVAGQGMARIQFSDKGCNVAFGAGYFDFVNAEGFSPFYDDEDSFGNSVVDVGNSETDDIRYVNDYNLLQLFGELNIKPNYFPVTLIWDFVNNSDADSNGTGWLVGFKAGETKKPGSWTVRYNYRKLEKDAVVGAFTDSDFRGGGTDGKGHEFGGSYQMAKNSTFAVTYFSNKLGLDVDDPETFSRLQLDLQYKF